MFATPFHTHTYTQAAVMFLSCLCYKKFCVASSSRMDMHLQRGVMMLHAAFSTSVRTKSWPCILTTT